MNDTGKDEHPVGIATRNIFLDTEVFRSNGHNLNTTIMKVLGDYLADEIFVLHTTDVTLREVSRQIRAMESKLTNRANKIVKELTRWNNRYRFDHQRLPVPDPLSKPAQPSSAYQAFEWIVRHDWHAHEHSTADLPIGPVLDQYFSHQAPFDKTGSKEFPDAIVLFALQEWCTGAQESIYVVSKDKAVQRAAEERDHLIAIDSLDRLFALVTAAQDHNVAETISAAFDELALRNEIQDTLSKNIAGIGGDYDADIVAMELIEVEEIENVIVLRVDQNQVSCVARVKLLVSAEFDYEDASHAIWDKEDGIYFGAESVTTEIQTSIIPRIFVQLERSGKDFTLSSAQFNTQEVMTVMDYVADDYFYG